MRISGLTSLESNSMINPAALMDELKAAKAEIVELKVQGTFNIDDVINRIENDNDEAIAE